MIARTVGHRLIAALAGGLSVVLNTYAIAILFAGYNQLGNFGLAASVFFAIGTFAAAVFCGFVPTPKVFPTVVLVVGMIGVALVFGLTKKGADPAWKWTFHIVWYIYLLTCSLFTARGIEKVLKEAS